MTVLLERSSESLAAERAEILTALNVDESVLRERAAEWKITAEEAQALRRIDAIDFLLDDRAHG